jgi:hypothetical protein
VRASDERFRRTYMVRRGISLVLVFVFGCARSALACSCVPLTLEQKIRLADVVFVGRVVEAEISGRIVIQVSGYWKSGKGLASVGKTMTLTSLSTQEYFHTCEFMFAAGHEFLVFAHASVNRLTTDICSGTRHVSDAKEELKNLGPPKRPQQAGS